MTFRVINSLKRHSWSVLCSHMCVAICVDVPVTAKKEPTSGLLKSEVTGPGRSYQTSKWTVYRHRVIRSPARYPKQSRGTNRSSVLRHRSFRRFLKKMLTSLFSSCILGRGLWEVSGDSGCPGQRDELCFQFSYCMHSWSSNLY